MAKLYLIRHEEPRVTGVMLGRMDVGLSSAGRERAFARLGGREFPAIWTSPMARARETAEAPRAGVVVEVPGLRELDCGEWTGLRWSEIEVRFPDVVAAKLLDWFGVTPPGGEPWAVFLERVGTAWSLIRRGPPGSAVVAHAGVNAALAHLIAGRDPMTFRQDYGEVDCIEYD